MKKFKVKKDPAVVIVQDVDIDGKKIPKQSVELYDDEIKPEPLIEFLDDYSRLKPMAPQESAKAKPKRKSRPNKRTQKYSIVNAGNYTEDILDDEKA